MRFIMLTDQRNAKMTKQFQKKKIFEIHGMSEIFTHVNMHDMIKLVIFKVYCYKTLQLI